MIVFHYTPLTSHVQGAEAPGMGLTRGLTIPVFEKKKTLRKCADRKIAKRDNNSRHTYNTNPPTSVKQHLQQWLSKCCTKLLNKELKHLCTRTQLDVKANYALHALTSTDNKTDMVSTNNTHAKKKKTNSPCFNKNQPATPGAVKTPLQRVLYKNKIPNPWQAGTEGTTKQCAV